MARYWGCSGTLQACIDAQSDGGVITVVTDAFIPPGTYIIDKGLTLLAGSGFHPKFTDPAYIFTSPTAGTKLTIRGFEFNGYSFIGALLTVGSETNIEGNTWINPRLGTDRYEGIQVDVSSFLTIGNTATINIVGNNLEGAGENGAFGFIDIQNNQTGTVKANIIDNHLDIKNTGSINPAILSAMQEVGK